MLATTNPTQFSPTTTNNLLVVFAEFLDIDVSAGDALYRYPQDVHSAATAVFKLVRSPSVKSSNGNQRRH